MRFRKAPCWDLIEHFFPLLFISPRLLPQRRHGDGRRDRVRRDTALAPLGRHTVRQAVQAGFGGAVCSMIRQSDMRRLRGNTDDTARGRPTRHRTMGLALRGRLAKPGSLVPVHFRKGLRDEHRAEDVDFERLLRHFRRRLLERRRLAVPRRVHQDGWEGRRGGLEHLLAEREEGLSDGLLGCDVAFVGCHIVGGARAVVFL